MAKKSSVTSKNGERKIAPAKTTATVKRTAPARKPVTKPKPVKPAPTREEIAKRAFEIYMGRGQVPGREQEDWAQAERELLAEAHRNN